MGSRISTRLPSCRHARIAPQDCPSVRCAGKQGTCGSVARSGRCRCADLSSRLAWTSSSTRSSWHARGLERSNHGAARTEGSTRSSTCPITRRDPHPNGSRKTSFVAYHRADRNSGAGGAQRVVDGRSSERSQLPTESPDGHLPRRTRPCSDSRINQDRCPENRRSNRRGP